MASTENPSHRYIPNTKQDQETILKAGGHGSFEALLQGIPTEIRNREPIVGNCSALSEFEIQDLIAKLFAESRAVRGGVSFLGAGSYDRYCPSIVNQLTMRGEFLTAYTPYQPENSQGTLQALFEFQSMVCEIFGMEVATASHYDGATSLAEAALLSLRVNKKRPVIFVSDGVDKDALAVMKTYLSAQNVELVLIPVAQDGRTDFDLSTTDGSGPSSAAAVVTQSPNRFGVVDDLSALCSAAQRVGGLSVVSVPDPVSMGFFEPPGAFGVDVVTAEGQGLGLPQSYGGPYLGLFCAKKEYVRQLPGRLCGESVDAEGKRSYTLTLSTREQHIRREKATSNICTNQSLCALWSTIWLASFGRAGFQELAEQNLAKGLYLAKQVASSQRATLRYPDSPFFNEFVVNLQNGRAEDFFEFATKQGIAPGIPLSRYDRADEQGLLVTVTEKRTKREMDRWIEVLSQWEGGVA